MACLLQMLEQVSYLQWRLCTSNHLTDDLARSLMQLPKRWPLSILAERLLCIICATRDDPLQTLIADPHPLSNGGHWHVALLFQVLNLLQLQLPLLFQSPAFLGFNLLLLKVLERWRLLTLDFFYSNVSLMVMHNPRCKLSKVLKFELTFLWLTMVCFLDMCQVQFQCKLC